MEDKLKDLLAKIDESIKKGDFKSSLKFLNKAVREARYDGVKSAIVNELNRKRIEIYDRIFIPLPKIFSNETPWILGLIIGAIIFYYSFVTEHIVSIISFLIGAALILVVTHPLAHIFIGRLYGIKIIKAYLGGVAKFEPTVIADFLTYFSAGPKQRRNYHAAGSITTVLTSLIIFLIVLFLSYSFYIKILALIIFIAILLTDVFFSPKYSDWKRARKELKYKEIKVEK